MDSPLIRHTSRTNVRSALQNEEWTQESGRRVAEYEDFTTIDWNYDMAKDRARTRELQRITGPYGNLYRLYDRLVDWIVIALVGFLTGLLAAFVDISCEWIGDIREVTEL